MRLSMGRMTSHIWNGKHVWNHQPALFDIPSGKRLHNELENHHFVAGEINDFSMAMASSSQTVNVYQRVYPINSPLNHYKIQKNHYKSII